MALINLRNLGVTLSAPLFSNLNLAIGPGDRLGIVAANGRGKSTLLRCIAGAFDPTPSKPVHPLSVNPSAAAPMPTAIDAVALTAARPSSSATVSYANVDYVVSAPQNPMPTSVPIHAGRPVPSPASAPRISEPATLTANVPTPAGRGSAARRRTGRTAPTAPPSITSSTVIGPAADRDRDSAPASVASA